MKRAMNNVNFNLKDTHSTKQTHIILIFRWLDQFLKYYTGLKVLPVDWNVKKQRAKEGGIKYLIQLNHRLDFIDQETKGIYLEYLNKNMPLRPATFRTELDKILFPEVEQENSFFAYFDKYIGGVRKEHETDTWRGYNTVKNLLVRYAESLPAGTLDWEDFDHTFYDKFKDWFYGQGGAPNSFGKAISVVKRVLRKGHKLKLYKTTDPLYKDEDFKGESEPAKSISLTMAELQQIYSLDLIKRLDHVRDWFLISCFTGLRYGDMVNFSPSDLKLSQDLKTGLNSYFFEVVTEKTDDEIVFPVHPVVNEIFNKYDGNLPGMITNQKFNKYLKEVAELAGLDSKVRATVKIDGRRVSKYVEKYTQVECHTGRRTFVSIAREFEMPADLIMSLVGHKSAAMFLKYNKQTAKQKAAKAFENDFYKATLKKVK